MKTNEHLIRIRRMTGVDAGKKINKGLFDMIEFINKPDCTMIEIGTHIGISTQIFANAFSHITTIDPYLNGYNNKKHRVGADREATAKRNLSSYKNVAMIKSTSSSHSFSIKNNSVDFVYIDGSHDINCVIGDIVLFVKKLKPSGFIGGHDYFKNKGNVSKAVDICRDIIPHKSFYLFDDSSWIMSLF